MTSCWKVSWQNLFAAFAVTLCLFNIQHMHNMLLFKFETDQGREMLVGVGVENKVLSDQLTGIEGLLRKVFAMPLDKYHKSLIDVLTHAQEDGALLDDRIRHHVMSLLKAETNRLLRLKDPCKVFSKDAHNKIFVWLRFSKIGGTTFNTYLEKFTISLGLGAVGCDVSGKDFETCGHLEGKSHDELVKINLLYGHQAFGNHRLFPDKEPVYIVISRDVSDQVNSFYNYQRKQGNHTPISLMDSIGRGIPHPNELTRYTCGPSFGMPLSGNICSNGDDLTLAVAKLNLARVDFIPGWFVDHFEDTKNVLVHSLWEGFNSMEADKKVMPAGIEYKSSRLTTYERQVVENIFHLDVELNIFIMAHFKRIQKCFV
mmetsp:Transcript_10353/g.15288  ORF Transcript_10353/g.15288 Transcript_10353/m.15288 type:complete len:371 (+) Transcript_10353:613-1725(+)